MIPFGDYDEDLKHFLVGFHEIVENSKNQALTELLVQLLRKRDISPVNVLRAVTYAFNDCYSNLDPVVIKIEDLIFEDLQKLSLQMIPQTDAQERTRIRNRISFMLGEFKREGVILSQLIRAMQDEAQRLTSEASADASQTTAANE